MKLTTFDLIGIGLRHMDAITEAVPHFVKGLQALRPLLDELDEKQITPETVKQAAKGFSDFEREWFRQAEG